MSQCNSDDDTVFSLEDLKQWNRAEPSLAVVGHPVSHSISPHIHNAALAELSKVNDRFKNWKYFKFDIDPEDLKGALSLFYEKNFIGLNLTIPHKFIAYKLIDKISEDAQSIEAINTLVKEPDGYSGYNTDGYGLEKAVKENFGVNISGNNIILIGAGGAAKAAAAQCLSGKCRSLWIGNRNQDRLIQLIKQLMPIANNIKLIGFNIEDDLPRMLPEDGILINATSLGLKLGDPSPVNLKFISREIFVYDMVYKSGKTQLIKDAETFGFKCSDGLSMLIWQGEKALELWTGTKSPITVMQKTANLILTLK